MTQDLSSLLPQKRENAVAFVRRYTDRLEPVLALGVRTGQLRADLDTAHAAEVIWALDAALAPGLLVGPMGAGGPTATPGSRARSTCHPLLRS